MVSPTKYAPSNPGTVQTEQESMDDLYARNPGTSMYAPAVMDEAAQAVAGSASAPGSMMAEAATAAQATAPDTIQTQDAVASTAGSQSAQAFNATVTGYDPELGQVQDEETAAGQLGKITSQDSPLMQRARANAAEYASRRGLRNSTIAAGETQAAMVDRALPVAQQDAAAHRSQALTNQEVMNRAREFEAQAENVAGLQDAQLQTNVSQTNAQLVSQAEQLNAQLATQTSQFNAEQFNQAQELNAQLTSQIEQLNAQLATAVSQQNAEAQNRINQQILDLQSQADQLNANLETQTAQFNATQQNQRLAQNAEFQQRANELTNGDVNRMRELVLSQNAELNKQYLAGVQAMDLADIQGRYNQLIAQNQTAAGFYDSYFNSISQIMANDQLPPDRVAEYVSSYQNMLESGLRMLESLNGLDLSDIGLNTTQTPNTASPITSSTAPSGPAAPSPSGPAIPAPENPSQIFQQWRAGTYRDPETGKVISSTEYARRLSEYNIISNFY